MKLILRSDRKGLGKRGDDQVRDSQVEGSELESTEVDDEVGTDMGADEVEA